MVWLKEGHGADNLSSCGKICHSQSLDRPELKSQPGRCCKLYTIVEISSDLFQEVSTEPNPRLPKAFFVPLKNLQPSPYVALSLHPQTLKLTDPSPEGPAPTL